jgi:hypothetical protein
MNTIGKWYVGPKRYPDSNRNTENTQRRAKRTLRNPPHIPVESTLPTDIQQLIHTNTTCHEFYKRYETGRIQVSDDEWRRELHKLNVHNIPEGANLADMYRDACYPDIRVEVHNNNGVHYFFVTFSKNQRQYTCIVQCINGLSFQLHILENGSWYRLNTIAFWDPLVPLCRGIRIKHQHIRDSTLSVDDVSLFQNYFLNFVRSTSFPTIRTNDRRSFANEVLVQPRSTRFDKNSLLYYLVQTGNLEYVKEHLENPFTHTDAVYDDTSTMHPFALAVALNEIDIVRYMLHRYIYHTVDQRGTRTPVYLDATVLRRLNTDAWIKLISQNVDQFKHIYDAPKACVFFYGAISAGYWSMATLLEPYAFRGKNFGLNGNMRMAITHKYINLFRFIILKKRNMIDMDNPVLFRNLLYRARDKNGFIAAQRRKYEKLQAEVESVITAYHNEHSGEDDAPVEDDIEENDVHKYVLQCIDRIENVDTRFILSRDYEPEYDSDSESDDDDEPRNYVDVMRNRFARVREIESDDDYYESDSDIPDGYNSEDVDGGSYSDGGQGSGYSDSESDSGYDTD